MDTATTTSKYKNVGPPNCPAEMHAGRVACCPLVSQTEYADGIDRQTDGSLVVRAFELATHEFDPRPPHYRSVGTGMNDRLSAGIPPRYVTPDKANSAS